MYRSAVRRTLRHASTTARPVAKAMEDEAGLLRPLVKLYHETETFPGQTESVLPPFLFPSPDDSRERR